MTEPLLGMWRRQLSPPLKSLLGCDNVWCDSRTEEGSQKFVLWAGCILERREEFQRVLGGRQFAFSMLVHSDESSPMVDFLATSSVLQACTLPHLTWTHDLTACTEAW